MDVSASKVVDLSSYGYSGRTASVQPDISAGKTEASPQIEADNPGAATKKEKGLSRDEVQHLTAEMNKMMQLLNADLRFAMHEQTKQLMVQVVDSKDQKVLKEFPPHELLDTMAKIKSYIGFLLDKKA